MSGPNIHILREDEVDRRREAGLVALLDQCFPGFFEGRTFFKQLPHFRLIAEEQDEIIGQAGVDHRMIKVGDQNLRVFGMIDVCVAEAHRNRGIAGAMLQKAEELAKRADVDFMVLIADKGGLYLKHGFRHVSPAPGKWMAIHELASIMMLEKDLPEYFMIKPVGDKTWAEGQIDMMGYLF